ncbi:MAG: DUF1194 domain-containing protein [Chromatiales bacterium]|jgi:hypothetical protein|nr:DUF1194 domain-containing protein [Chromatiales bacterium]
MKNIKSVVAGLYLAVAAILVLVAAHAPARAVPVDLMLSLVIDESGSVDGTEFGLQLNGYKAAFLDSGIQTAISSFANGIAVNVILFAGTPGVATTPSATLNFSHLTDAASITAFANLLGLVTRPGNANGSSTGIADAIDFAVGTFGASSFTSDRKVIDVSGDGEENVAGSPFDDGPTGGKAQVRAVRDAAIAAGFIINGLPIIDDFVNLDTYYADNVIGGPGSFLEVATFASFEDAVISKISQEITLVPEPPAIFLLGAGLFFMLRRHQKT